MMITLKRYSIILLVSAFLLMFPVVYYAGRPCVKNSKGELCMDKSSPYVEVPGANQAPVELKHVPDALINKLPIIQVTYQQLIDEMTHKTITKHHHGKTKIKHIRYNSPNAYHVPGRKPHKITISHHPKHIVHH